MKCLIVSSSTANNQSSYLNYLTKNNRSNITHVFSESVPSLQAMGQYMGVIFGGGQQRLWSKYNLIIA